MKKKTITQQFYQNRDTIGWALGLAVIAYALRIIYLIQWSHDPGFESLMVDEKWHWLWAGDILDKSFWGDGTWFRGPLYPYFLALLRFITGDSIFWSKALQLLLSGATCFLTVRLTAHLLGKRAGVIAGCIYAIYGTLFFYDSMFLVETLFWPLCVWGVYRAVTHAESASWKSWGATGIVFGLAALTRPNVLLVVPCLCLWLFWKQRKQAPLSRAIQLPAILGICTIIAILPATIRNVAVTGEFILISSQGGVNFYIGNNPAANGLTMVIPEVVLNESVAWDQFIPVTNDVAEKEAGRKLSDGEISGFWTQKTVSWISNNVSDFMALTARKCAYLISGFENSDNGDIYFHRQKSSLYSFLLWDSGINLPWGVLFPLAVIGAALTWKYRVTLTPLYVFVVAYIPTIVLFLVTARHRMVLVPFMIVVAAGGLSIAWDKRSQWSFRKWVGIASVFVALILISNRTYFEAGRGAEFQNYYAEGLRLMAAKDYHAAELEFIKAHKSWPYSATATNNLGYMQFLQGKVTSASQNYTLSIQLDSNFYQPFNNLGLLVMRGGNPDSAKKLFHLARRKINAGIEKSEDVAQVHRNFGEALLRTNDIEGAKRQFDTAIGITNGDPALTAQIATTCAELKQFAFADTLFMFAAQSDKLTAAEWLNWGISRLQWQKWNDAEYPLTRCLETNPQLAQGWYCLAFARLQQGETRDKVIGILDRALVIDPNYQQAKNLKNQILQNR